MLVLKSVRLVAGLWRKMGNPVICKASRLACEAIRYAPETRGAVVRSMVPMMLNTTYRLAIVFRTTPEEDVRMSGL